MATVTGTRRLLDISGNNITTAVSLEAEGTLLDVNGTSGTSGQLLSSTGTGVDWVSNNSGSWDGIFSGSAQITGSLGVTGSINVKDGNVGIGANSADYPYMKLIVDGGNFVIGDDSANQQLVLGFDYLGDELGIFKYNTDQFIAGMYNDNYGYGNDPYSPYLFISGSNGNIGIGTTNPGAKLDISGNLRISDDGTNLMTISNESAEDYLSIFQSSNNKATLTFGDVDEQYGTLFTVDVENEEISLFTNGTITIGDNGFGNSTKFVVDDVNSKFTFLNGNVGIGTSTPTEKLQIGLGTGTGSDGIFIKGTFAGGTAYGASKNPFISLGTSTDAGYTSTIYLGSSATATDQDSKIEFNKSNNALSIYHKGQGTYREHVRFGDPGNSTPKSIFFGNVGIGVTSPSAALDVSVAYKAARFVSTQNTGLEVQGGGNSQNIAIFKNAGGYAEVVIDTAGKVGIGVTSPSAELDVSTSGKAARFVSSQSTGLEVQGGANSQDLAIFKNPGGITELVIKSTGNVGIGNNFNSPSEKLEVSGGNLKVSNTGMTTLTLNSTNSTGAQIFALRNGATSPPMGSLSWSNSSGISLAWYSTTYSQNSLVLDGSNFIVTNNGSERMRIISSGNVGIGTTSPSTKLHVVDSAAPQVRIGNDTFNYLNISVDGFGNSTIAPTGNGFALPSLTLSTGYGSIKINGSADGNVGIGTTSPSEKLEVDGNVQADTLIATDLSDGYVPYNRNGTLGLQDSEIYQDGGQVGIGTTTLTQTLNVDGDVLADGYRLSAMQTAPASRTAAGTLGEIRITSNAIYVCYATNSWSKVTLDTSW